LYVTVLWATRSAVFCLVVPAIFADSYVQICLYVLCKLNDDADDDDDDYIC